MATTQQESAMLHHQTPTVILTGSAGSAVRTLAFLRRSAETGSARCLSQRRCYDHRTRTLRTFGARPLAENAPDSLTLSSLTGLPLLTRTADGGTSHALSDIEGRPVWASSAESTLTTWYYEAPTLPGRLLSVTEQAAGAATARICQAYVWGGPEAASRNLAGAPVQVWDNAGLTERLSVSLTAVPLEVRCRLLTNAEDSADWQDDDAHRQAPLEPVARALVTRVQSDATGALLTETNAGGVTTHTCYGISGVVLRTWLSREEQGQTRNTEALRSVSYAADGRVLSRTDGNGVLICNQYDEQTRQLIRMTVARPAGHPQGEQMLQDLHYSYDPVGNVLTQYDAAVDTRWHGNQQIDGKWTYEYDSLYRLTGASGRERLPDTAKGPLAGLQYDLSGGQGVWHRYTEQYEYDDGDNLIRVRHQGNSGWTREMAVSASSNRAELKTAERPSPEPLFTPGGCQRALADGRALIWHADGQLAEVSPVVRAGGENDHERYQYASAGVRVRKVRTVRTSGGEQSTLVTYAGGTERRQRSVAGGALTLDVVITESAGVRLIQDHISGSSHIRYTLSDRLGSVTGETDESGRVTSREEYYPYGGSAGSDEETSEVVDRTRRYSGKERDATGLYYYGYRYYQPGLCRWLSADPGGTIDGVNLYRMVRNNPVRLRDTDGLAPTAEIVKKDVKSVYENHEIGVMIDYYALGHASQVKENIKNFLDEYASEDVTDEELEAHSENVATQVIRGVAQRSAMQNPGNITLTGEEKKYVQRFYSTNAGAEFINTRARNLFRKEPMAVTYPDWQSAVNKGAQEGASTGPSILPSQARQHIKSAFQKGEPLAVMRAALADGENIYSEYQYRGTRIPKEVLNTYTPGTVLKNVFFASFSPDATNDRGKIINEGEKTAKNFFGIYASDTHIGENVLYELQPRSGVQAIKIHSANEFETIVAPGQKFTVIEKKQEKNYWRIKLGRAENNVRSYRYMFN